MSHEKALEVSKWMSLVAERYNKSIVTVIVEFKAAIEELEDIELAKLSVVKTLSQRGESRCKIH